VAQLNNRDRGRIIELLEKGEDLPLDYKHVLFPPEKKEYELVYAGKEREEDILVPYSLVFCHKKQENYAAIFISCSVDAAKKALSMLVNFIPLSVN
jgi:hypothetical protein